MNYQPVIMHAIDTRYGIGNTVEGNADRFERLNGVRPQIITANEMAMVAPNKYWYPAWVWDYVDPSVERILYMDSKILPVKALPEIPDVVFAAASDRADRVRQGGLRSKVVEQTGKYFQMSVFVAHRSMRPSFDKLKTMAKLPAYNEPDERGADGRGHLTPFNTVIQAATDVYELPKSWNWLITYEKEYFTPSPHMINLAGVATWSYLRYIKLLIERIEFLGGES